MVIFKDIVISAFLLALTTDIDDSVEEVPCDNCGIVEIVDVVVFAGGSHFTIKFP